VAGELLHDAVSVTGEPTVDWLTGAVRVQIGTAPPPPPAPPPPQLTVRVTGSAGAEALAA